MKRQEVINRVEDLKGGQDMQNEVLELLAGTGYGVVKGVVKTFVPVSKGVFDYMDDCIKNVSGTAAIGQCVGEKVATAIVLVL